MSPRKGRPDGEKVSTLGRAVGEGERQQEHRRLEDTAMATRRARGAGKKSVFGERPLPQHPFAPRKTRKDWAHAELVRREQGPRA